MVVILMGVSGAGKTTIGQALSQALGWEFHDADALHPPENVEKMRCGVALNDQDRAPWLERVRELIARWLSESRSAVIACSALKKSYREQIMVDASMVKVVYLKVDRATIERRLAHRTGHFMNPALIRSQFDTLQEPRNAIVVDATGSTQKIVDDIRSAL